MATYEAKRTGQNPEDYFDLAIVAIIFSIIGARAYYVIFSWDKYKDNLLNIFRLRQGGLAIYGGVIAAIITTLVFAKIKNLSFPKLADTAGLGLILGQIIGRWGNFFNREAFGGYTDGLLAMQIPVDAVRDSSDITAEMLEHIVEVGEISYIQVHPTFLYESLWCFLGFILLIIIRNKNKYNTKGLLISIYSIWYGIGRLIIEGMRTDSLYIGIFRISKIVSIILIILGIIGIIYIIRRNKNERK